MAPIAPITDHSHVNLVDTAAVIRDIPKQEKNAQMQQMEGDLRINTGDADLDGNGKHDMADKRARKGLTDVNVNAMVKEVDGSAAVNSNAYVSSHSTDANLVGYDLIDVMGVDEGPNVKILVMYFMYHQTIFGFFWVVSWALGLVAIIIFIPSFLIIYLISYRVCAVGCVLTGMDRRHMWGFGLIVCDLIGGILIVMTINGATSMIYYHTYCWYSGW